MQSKRNLAILVINYSGRGGGEGGGGEALGFGGSHGFHGEQRRNQSSPTSMKRQST